MFDDNGDGTITVEEMLGLVSKIGGNLTEGEAVALIRQADADSNGVIDKEEFRELWGAVRCSSGDEVGRGYMSFRSPASDSISTFSD